MKAGRELDALIAEKVMGFKLVAEEVEIGKPMHELFRAPNGRGYYHYQLPRYSTNIADAWEVVEKLVSTPGPNGDHHSVRVDYSGDAVVVIDENEDWQVSAIAETAPLAICLTALKAVSQEGQG